MYVVYVTVACDVKSVNTTPGNRFQTLLLNIVHLMDDYVMIWHSDTVFPTELYTDKSLLPNRLHK